MSYVPAKLKVFHPKKVVSYTVEDADEQPQQIDVFPGFATDAVEGNSHETARNWAAGYQWQQNEYGETEFDNEPVESIRVVGLEHRRNGGRAWKIVDRGFLFDLREQALLDLVMNGAGVFSQGIVSGPFIWISNSGMRLVRVGSTQHLEATKGKPKDPTLSLLSQGDVFKQKPGKFLVLITEQSRKEEMWLTFKEEPTQEDLSPEKIAELLITGKVSQPTKRPVLPANSLIGNLKVDLEEVYCVITRKVLNEPVKWVGNGHKLFTQLSKKTKLYYSAGIGVFVDNVSRLQAAISGILFPTEKYKGVDQRNYWLSEYYTAIQHVCDLIGHDFYGFGNHYAKSKSIKVKPLNFSQMVWKKKEQLDSAGFQSYSGNELADMQFDCPECAKTAKEFVLYDQGRGQNGWEKRGVFLEKVSNHFVHCGKQTAENKMKIFEQAFPGGVERFQLKPHHFEDIVPPYIKGQFTYNDYARQVKEMMGSIWARDLEPKLISSFDYPELKNKE